MKKYFLTMATVALFAIGFAASDEEESSSNSSNDSSKPQTEQKQEKKQESPAEKKAREKEEKMRRVKTEADRWGRICPFSRYSAAEDDCKARYIDCFGTPTTEEDFEMYKKWKEIFMALWKQKQDAKKQMDNM